MQQTIRPSLADMRRYAEDYKAVPLYLTLPAGAHTPDETFRVLKNLSRHCYILESAETDAARGRYTFLGYDPKLEITCENGDLRVRGGADFHIKTDDPGAHIRSVLADNLSPRLPELPPFTGGLVGYFAYDYVKYAEPLLRLERDPETDAENEERFKDVDLMLFDKVIAYDHRAGQILLIVNARTDAPEENYNRAAEELAALRRVVEDGAPAELPPLELLSDFRPRFDKAAYCRMVERAKTHIFEGDIFQVVLSNRYDADARGSLFETYRILRGTNPSPYMFYLSSDDI
ncbi:MAG: chorismate-binding protein, partial [Oscillospiraceae bacterium]|nr:chorismate-binding protein [Oscillospiraceae bacterium]